jgi:phosphoglucosamine mutase
MLFGTDGVRGLASYFFEKALAYNLGRAVVCRGGAPKKVVVARDTRLSGAAIESEIIRGLSEYPTEIVAVSVAPTPAVSEILRNIGADYGIMVSASHNPPEYNGVKIFDKSGRKLTAEEEAEIERAVFSFWNENEISEKGERTDGKIEARPQEKPNEKNEEERLKNAPTISVNAERNFKNIPNKKDADAPTISVNAERNFKNIPNKKDVEINPREQLSEKNAEINPRNTLNKKDANALKECGKNEKNPLNTENAERNPQDAERRKAARAVRFDDAERIYEKSILNRLGTRFDGLNIRLDCCFGACSKIAPEIFRAAGANVCALADEADGSRVNVGTGSTNIGYLKANMSPSDFLGCAFDGDGDRMLAVAPNGFVIDGDYILYVLTLFFKRRGLLKNNTVVGTLTTNYGLEDALKKEGVKLLRTDVGDKYVAERLDGGGYSLGGETSGHIIMNENGRGATGDGILAALYLVRAFFELGIKPNETAALYRAFPQKTVNIKASAAVGEAVLKDERLNALSELCGEALSGAGRILIRRSGTEDKLRITVEARTEKTVDEVLSLLIPAYEKACAEILNR